MSFTFATYQSATGCTKYGPAGCQALLTYLEDRFPYQFSMGICNCRSARGTTSWSHHAECRAYDEGIPTQSNGRARPELGMPIINLLGPKGRQIGIDHMIYNRRIWSAKSPGGRYYSGVHPHYDHIHIGLTRNAGRNLTYGTLVSLLGPASATGGEELVLYGMDIGKVGDASLPEKPEYGVLQAFLVRQGFNLGAWGPNKDGVDRKPGDDTRKGLHAWKTKVGITSALSAGEGKIGDYEMAAIYAAGGATSSHADSSHTTLATKKAVDTLIGQVNAKIDAHVNAKISGPHG